MVRKRTLPSYYNPQINECDNLNVRRACAPRAFTFMPE